MSRLKDCLYKLSKIVSGFDELLSVKPFRKDSAVKNAARRDRSKGTGARPEFCLRKTLL
jgi:hypothetical protein